MISTILLEPYTFPKVTPISVTILRGARRMRFSRTLRPRYADFAPRLWLFLQRLGYKKFLQRIYIDLDVEKPVTHQYYEFPILLEVLRKLGILQQVDNIATFGKIRTSEALELPSWFSETLFSHALTEPTRAYFPTESAPLIQELNKLQQQGFTEHLPIPKKTNRNRSTLVLSAVKSKNPEQAILPHMFLYPGIAVENNAISLTKTAYSHLNKLDLASIEYFSFTWTNLLNPPSGQLFDWLCTNKSFLDLAIYARPSDDNHTQYEKYAPICDFVKFKKNNKEYLEPIEYLLEI